VYCRTAYRAAPQGLVVHTTIEITTEPVFDEESVDVQEQRVAHRAGAPRAINGCSRSREGRKSIQEPRL